MKKKLERFYQKIKTNCQVSPCYTISTKEEKAKFREENGRDRTLSDQAEYEANTIEDEVDRNDKIEKECTGLIKKGLDFFKNLM